MKFDKWFNMCFSIFSIIWALIMPFIEFDYLNLLLSVFIVCLAIINLYLGVKE